MNVMSLHDALNTYVNTKYVCLSCRSYSYTYRLEEARKLEDIDISIRGVYLIDRQTVGIFYDKIDKKENDK